jgi:hypothetical protein
MTNASGSGPGSGRLIDSGDAGSMEKKKRAGSF